MKLEIFHKTCFSCDLECQKLGSNYFENICTNTKKPIRKMICFCCHINTSRIKNNMFFTIIIPNNLNKNYNTSKTILNDEQLLKL